MALRTYDERSLAGKILHIDRNGRGLAGHRFCPTRTTSTASARSSTRRASATRSASTCARARRRSWATSAGTTREELDFVEAGEQLRLALLRGRDANARLQGAPRVPGALRRRTRRRKTPPVPPLSTRADGDGAIVAGPQYTATRYPAEYRSAWFFGDYGARAGSTTTTSSPASHQRAHRSPRRASRRRPRDHARGRPRLRHFTTGARTVERAPDRLRQCAAAGVAHATPTAGHPPLTVTLSADESVDPDGDAVSYGWDFDGDGTTTPARRTDRTNTRPGQAPPGHADRPRRARARDRDTVAVAVDDTPPVAQHRRARGRRAVPARDPGRSCEARRPTPTTASCAGGAELADRPAPRQPHPPRRVGPPGWRGRPSRRREPRCRLLLRDRAHGHRRPGPHDSETVQIRPETIALTLASSPPGVPLSYAGREYPAPARLTSAVGTGRRWRRPRR